MLLVYRKRLDDVGAIADVSHNQGYITSGENWKKRLEVTANN